MPETAAPEGLKLGQLKFGGCRARGLPWTLGGCSVCGDLNLDMLKSGRRTTLEEIEARARECTAGRHRSVVRSQSEPRVCAANGASPSR